jgi:outer membrane protein TolC
MSSIIKLRHTAQRELSSFNQTHQPRNYEMSRFSRALKVSLSAVALAALAACGTVKPVPLTGAERAEQVVQGRLLAAEGVDKIEGPLTLEDAMARALKFNLDRRVRMMEEALALGQTQVAQLDMLPSLLAQAGYTRRNNDRISQSRDTDGDLVESRFISQERSSTLSELGLSWSLLDIGMGYYTTQQHADRFLIALEKRRKAMHLLMQDVRVAFWRAASAQAMADKVKATIEQAEAALEDARKVEDARVRNPVDTLRYQRQLLENIRLLESIAQELSTAQVDLAHLINSPLTQELRVVEPKALAGHKAALARPVEELEETALMNNPDLREQGYNARISRVEARKTLLSLFPNLSFSYRLYHDTDSFLVNNRWNQAGTQLSWNLMNLLTYGPRNDLAQASIALADQRRVMVQASVIAQVHLARLQLANAVRQMERSDQIFNTDQRLAEIVTNREAVQAQSKLEKVSSDTGLILSQLRRYQALAAVQAAEARLEATLGVEPVVPGVSDKPVAALSRLLAEAPRGQVPVASALPSVSAAQAAPEPDRPAAVQ